MSKIAKWKPYLFLYHFITPKDLWMFCFPVSWLWTLLLSSFLTMDTSTFQSLDYEHFCFPVSWLWTLLLSSLLTMDTSAFQSLDYGHFCFPVSWLWTLLLSSFLPMDTSAFQFLDYGRRWWMLCRAHRIIWFTSV